MAFCFLAFMGFVCLFVSFFLITPVAGRSAQARTEPPHHGCNPSHNRDNTRSSTSCTMREPHFFLKSQARKSSSLDRFQPHIITGRNISR